MTHLTDSTPIELASHTWFCIGGNWVTKHAETYLEGAMYVEHYQPVNLSGTAPIVAFHGGVQTGTNFVSTPDGRRGWLHDFLRAGFEVYLVDQPERGRSGHRLSSDGPDKFQRYSAERTETMFTAPAHSRRWPRAYRHSQWPGTGRMGDEVFEQFFASQVEMLHDRLAIETLARDAGIALIEKLGSAILLTHSQSGPFGWLIADARPDKVKAVIAIEPNGPPFFDVQHLADSGEWYRYNEKLERPYGITRAPLAFVPAVTSADPLVSELVPSEHPDEQIDGYVQAPPARQLPNLKMPIVIVVAEASYHAVYDHVTSAFLTQAGVEHDYIELADRGLRGNGHMVMLEQNNHEIADLLINWLSSKL